MESGSSKGKLDAMTSFITSSNVGSTIINSCIILGKTSGRNNIKIFVMYV